jgi:hypothetical protein
VSNQPNIDPEHPALRLIQPGESLHLVAKTAGADLVLTDRRLAVAAGERVALDIAFEGLRRVQFDIERDRPATLVIVPEHPAQEPQVLVVPPDRYDEVTQAIAAIGHRIAGVERQSGEARQ